MVDTESQAGRRFGDSTWALQTAAFAAGVCAQTEWQETPARHSMHEGQGQAGSACAGACPDCGMFSGPNSYGFRRGRSTADAIELCFNVLAPRRAARWVPEGDIAACYDRISHEWLQQRVPMATSGSGRSKAGSSFTIGCLSWFRSQLGLSDAPSPNSVLARLLQLTGPRSTQSYRVVVVLVSIYLIPGREWRHVSASGGTEAGCARFRLAAQRALARLRVHVHRHRRRRHPHGLLVRPCRRRAGDAARHGHDRHRRHPHRHDRRAMAALRYLRRDDGLARPGDHLRPVGRQRDAVVRASTRFCGWLDHRGARRRRRRLAAHLPILQ